MFLEELFEGPFLKSGLHKRQRKFDRTEYIDSQAQAAEMQARVDAIQDEVGPNEYAQSRLDNLIATGDPKDAALADKIEDHYYHGEAGISGQSPHEQDINRQTGMQQWQADMAKWYAMTPEERAAYLAYDLEQQKRKKAEDEAKAEAEKKRKAEEKRKAQEKAAAELEKNGFIPG